MHQDITERRNRAHVRDFGLDIKKSIENSDQKIVKEHTFVDMITFQLIWCVIISIVMILGHTFMPKQFNSGYVTFKELFANDFSFKEAIYESVGGFITTLNQYTPGDQTDETGDELDGVGGEENPVEKKTVPHNATFAPILHTGTITFPIADEHRITSEFGFRIHPITKKDDFHNALDIAAKEGTSIKAIANGVVTKVAKDDSLGEYIIIDHGNNFSSKYAHCSKVIAKEGMKIREGEVVAKVGSTGQATGPHLHLSTIKNDLYFNPQQLFERILL